MPSLWVVVVASKAYKSFYPAFQAVGNSIGFCNETYYDVRRTGKAR